MKNEPLCIRQTDEEKADLARVSALYDAAPATLARKLISRFIKASDAHGENLFFPPQYNYIPKDPVSARYGIADELEEQHNRKAQSNKITVCLSDPHWQQLVRYREKTGAHAESVINALIQSYIQKMIDSEDTITPNFPGASYTRLVFDGPCFHVEQGDVYDQFAAWLRNEAPEAAKTSAFLMRAALVKDRESRPATVLKFPKNPSVRLAAERAAHE